MTSEPTDVRTRVASLYLYDVAAGLSVLRDARSVGIVLKLERGLVALLADYDLHETDGRLWRTTAVLRHHLGRRTQRLVTGRALQSGVSRVPQISEVRFLRS